MMTTPFGETVQFIRDQYRTTDFIPLHVPVFAGMERAYLTDCIDTGFVSSVGEYVNKFEAMIREYTGAAAAVATVNGTAALHVALRMVGVGTDDLVVTQAITFVATANAIAYCGATPAFVDCEPVHLSMDPEALGAFLTEECRTTRHGSVVHELSGRRVAACVAVDVFGHPCRAQDIARTCEEWGLPLVEDAAEALGSYRGSEHAGLAGKLGTLSFNGNKTITTGGGGMIITSDEELGKTAKHVTTTAKRPHRWEYFHDVVGYNYRMPNVNAALGCAQLEKLDSYLADKRKLAAAYKEYFAEVEGIDFVAEPPGTRSNHWLNAVRLPDRDTRDAFLDYTNGNGIMTRPVWEPMHTLPMYADAPRGDLDTTRRISDTVVNIPSSVRVDNVQSVQ